MVALTYRFRHRGPRTSSHIPLISFPSPPEESMQSLSSHDYDRTLTRTSKSTYEDLLPHCWRLNTCDSCLDNKDYACGWCPYSSACIPNPATFPLLSPLTNPLICPDTHGHERWELRAKGLGCNVSTRNFLSVVVTVVGTLAVVGLVWVSRVVWRAIRRRYKRKTWSSKRWNGKRWKDHWATGWAGLIQERRLKREGEGRGGEEQPLLSDGA